METKQAIFLIVGLLIFLVIFGAIEEVGEKFGWFTNLSGSIAKYVFGFEETTYLGANLTSYATIVTFLMIWLIIFVTFGDIIESFSSFSPEIAWIIAFALAVVGGLMGIVGGAFITMTKIFIFAGTAAVYLALGTSIFAFLAVNFGITPLTAWIKRRKLMKEAVEGEIGAEEVAEGVKNIRKIQQAFTGKRKKDINI